MNTQTYEHSFEVAAPAKLVVKNVHGKVLVTPGPEGIIRIKEIHRLDSGSAELTKVEVMQDDSGRVLAAVEMSKRLFGAFMRRPERVDFEIEAPAETNLKVNNISGPIAAKGLQGDISLKSVSGAIKVKDLNGDLRLDSVSGRITGANLIGPADVDTVSGKVELRGCNFSELDLNGVSGKVLVETDLGAGAYHLQTVSGSLTLVAPADSKCQVDARSVSGRFVTDLPASQSSVGRGRWQIKLGKGSSTTQVHMKTVSGKMRLLSALDAVGSTPAEAQLDAQDRNDVLNRLSEGEIDVQQAIQELDGR